MANLGIYTRVIQISLESHAYFDYFNVNQGCMFGEVWHCQ